MAGPAALDTGIDELIAAARSRLVPGSRQLLGIAGAPGSGKSTLAAILASALGADAALVGMDAFHLADAELRRLGRHDRKGAADTFDAAGYLNLLQRLRDRTDPVVYAPVFERSLEAAIAGAQPVAREVPLIITEGNYLLVDDQDWAPARALLDECWFIESDERLRLSRLTSRHRAYGRSAEQAELRACGSDQRNAELVGRTRHRADRVIRLPPLPESS